jgi:hypothetical protein
LGHDCTGISSGALGEFTTSDNGLILYYGDVNGNILAVQLGTSSVPTTPPSDFPTTDVPSMIPSSVPSELPSARPSVSPPSESGQTTKAPTPPPTTPGPTEPTEPTEPTSSGYQAVIIASASTVVGLTALLFG